MRLSSPDMELIDFKPGIIPNFSRRLKERKFKFTILEHGKLTHSSGKQLLPSKVYECQHLPTQGEWLVVKRTKLLCYQEGELDLDLSVNRQSSIFSASNGKYAEKKVWQYQDFAPSATRKTIETKETEVAKTPSQNSIVKQLRKIFNSYPIYRQQSANDCGAACLLMVGQYWGKHFDYGRVAEMAKINRTGASLKEIIDAAELMGFSAFPGKTDLLGLEKNSLPVIAHWQNNHYVVVYSIDKKQVIIGDPEIGKLFLSRSDFCRGWSGYAVWLEPTIRFYQTSNESTVSFGQFVNLLTPYKVVLLEVLIASIFVQILGLIAPILTQVLIDDVVNSSAISTFIAVGSGLLGIKIIQELIVSIRRYLLFHTANRLDLNLIVNFVSHTLKLPLSYFDSRYVGDLISRIDENRKIRQFVTRDAITTILDVFSVFVYIALMFWYSPLLSVCALIVVPILSSIAFFSTPILMVKSRQVFAKLAREQSYLIEFLSGIATLKSMGIERTVLHRWQILVRKYFNISFSTVMLQEKLRLAANLIEIIVSTLVLLLGIWLVIDRQLTIGKLIAFNMLVGQVISPCKRLTLLWQDFQEIRIAIERTSDVLKQDIEPGLVGRSLIELPQFTGNITFERVSFSYDRLAQSTASPASQRVHADKPFVLLGKPERGRYSFSSGESTAAFPLESNSSGVGGQGTVDEESNSVIDNLSFKIEPGQTVALVGKSGSGKTTIAKLVLGLHSPTSGEILIDGYRLNNLDKRSYRTQIGVVDQNTFLFGGTILENLTIAHPQATRSEIESACKLAACDFIEKLPAKYETKIGEGGGLLSGGQKQRLAIARALVGNPKLLILDEATSNLDTESERIIQENLHHVLANRTTLVIAHRLSTVRYADVILVMEKGKLVESGTHLELVARRGMYYRLVNEQFGVG